ncbi:MAG TPA: dihydrodipicolinate synthase family protein [Armatimonadota bacterium]|nr:dihydrodipicolinate synthase family protein [Armatimonadota bacterium]
MRQLRGVVPPVITPLHADERVDEEALERQLERLVRAGVHGIFFLGSTGEQPALRDSERARALRVARRVVAGRVPLIVGTMASSTARAIDNIRAAEEGGADAVAVTPPHYYPSRGEAEQLAHYRACAAATALPVVIYNIPLTTKVMVAPETMARIAEIPNVAGVKDSSGDFGHFLQVLQRTHEAVGDRPGFGVLIGSPALAGAAMLAGADGVVPGIANIDPRTMLNVHAAGVAHNTDALRGLQHRVHRLMSLLSFGPPIVCIKTALELMGICSHHAAAPLQPLPPEKREAIATGLRELELL